MRRAMAGLSDRGIIASVTGGARCACRGHSLVTMQSEDNLLLGCVAVCASFTPPRFA
jgi:hypothetical protein